MAGNDGAGTLGSSADCGAFMPYWWHNTGWAVSIPSHGSPAAIISAIVVVSVMPGQTYADNASCENSSDTTMSRAVNERWNERRDMMQTKCSFERENVEIR